LHGKVLVAGGPAGVVSVRSCYKLPLNPTQSMPARFKMDLFLAKIKPISNGGITFVITYSRKEKKNPNLHSCSLKRGVRI